MEVSRDNSEVGVPDLRIAINQALADIFRSALFGRDGRLLEINYQAILAAATMA